VQDFFYKLVMFVMWFCDEYSPVPTILCILEWKMFDNFNLDMSAEWEIVIWAFFYLSNRVCVVVLKSFSSLGFVIDCNNSKTPHPLDFTFGYKSFNTMFPQT
jgi:hypothetical protein